MDNGRFTLTRAYTERWLYNTAIFFAPAALLFLMAIQSGKSLSEALIVIELWGINTAIDIIRKFIAKNP